MCKLMFRIRSIHLFLVALGILALLPSIESDCSEIVCGSIVSKCLLTKSCECTLNDCSCCNDCVHCLGELFPACCSCLDMCPLENETSNAVGPKSEIGDFEGVPELFEILVSEDDDDQWYVMRLPMHRILQNHFNMAKGYHFLVKPNTVNCTVMYFNKCKSNRKCADQCESMGANSYRWFHDGCCECVGANCYNYGINENHCIACPDDDGTDGIDGAEEDDDDDLIWD